MGFLDDVADEAAKKQQAASDARVQRQRQHDREREARGRVALTAWLKEVGMPVDGNAVQVEEVVAPYIDGDGNLKISKFSWLFEGYQFVASYPPDPSAPSTSEVLVKVGGGLELLRIRMGDHYVKTRQDIGFAVNIDRFRQT
jgi:hypothetical protein